MPKAINGIDNQSQRLRSVAPPQASDDGVPMSFIRYDLNFACVGKQQSASEVIGMYTVPSDLAAGIMIPSNLAGSIARALSAASSQTQWTLTRVPAGASAESVIATITFAANGLLATFSQQAALTLGMGDMMRLIGPSSADATLADISFMIRAGR